MTEILLTPEDYSDQIVPIKGRAVYAYLQKLFAPYGSGKVLGIVQLTDGIHVHYAGGSKQVFRPTAYSGRVKDGPTPGTFVADI